MKSQAVKDKILDVSSRLFYEQGYNTTGINQIIAEAGIAKASLYHHFPSKNDLLFTYLEEKDKSWFEQLDAFLARYSDARSKLPALFDFRIKRQLDQHFGGCAFVRASVEIPASEQKALAFVRGHKEHFKRDIKSLVKQLQGEHLLSPDQLSDTLYLLMEGAIVDAQIMKRKTSLAKAKKIALQLING